MRTKSSKLVFITAVLTTVYCPDVGSLTTRSAPGTAISNRFYRVQAIKPLSP